MNEHLSSTPSTDEQPKPTIPAAYRIYGEEVPDFEDGMGAAFWVAVLAMATILCLLGWAVYLAVSWVALLLTALGTAAALGAWWGFHWLARRMERDDDKDRGVFHD